GDAVVIDPCGDLAGAPCEEDCTFTPTDIDCLAACANMAVICDGDGGDCSAECDGQILDPDDCFDACMGARILFCGNEAFGCFEANESCAEVSTCYGETM
ncbi:MAG: hypothetical protein OXT09_29200, partial [Myxococcales bacterium]|nr:hypothetical protein [Myxococcales bacterium]